MRLLVAICAPALVATQIGCASMHQPDEALLPAALAVAQQRGATELGCSTTTAEVKSKRTIEEPQATGWFEPPHRAAYTVAVAGCGQQATYAIGCDDREKQCTVGPVATAPPPQPLADKLQPDAVRTAQQHAASVFLCAQTTTDVMDQDTIQEPQATGWYEAPHRVKYAILVSGCGKQGTYAVTCDDRKVGCDVGSVVPAGPPPQPLADKMRGAALQAAQQRGASALSCPSVAAELVSTHTMEEPQTTGWYEPPHHVRYNVGVSGCAARASYSVLCDDRESESKWCVVGTAADNSRN